MDYFGDIFPDANAGIVRKKVKKLDQSILKPEQAEAVIKIKEFLASDKDVFLFIGPPGSGKTFTIKYALEDEIPEITYGGTMSHAAKAVLRDSVGDYMKCFTVAQLLGQTPVEDKFGRLQFIQDKSRNIRVHIAEANIVVIDECSMITNDIYDTIMRNAPSTSKIIFMGDSYQLPAVGNDVIPKVFQIEDRAELTESVRFSGAIGELATYYRQYQDWVRDTGGEGELQTLLKHQPCIDDPESLVWFYYDQDVFDRIAHDRFSRDEFGTRVLAYRNDNIDHYNSMMRGYFHNHSDPVTIGERIILNAPYKKGDNKMHNGEVFECTGYTNTTEKVNVMLPSDTYRMIEESIYFSVYLLELRNVLTEEVMYAPIVHNIDQAKRIKVEGQLKQIALADKRRWRAYYEFKEKFLNWSYTYACTTHKAQGQSINSVFVMANDILSVPNISNLQRLQSLYVAATRARKELHILL